MDKKWSEVGQKLDKIEAVLGVLGPFCHCEVAPSNRSNLIAESQRVDLQVGPHFYLFKTEDKKEICYRQYKIENDKPDHPSVDTDNIRHSIVYRLFIILYG